MQLNEENKSLALRSYLRHLLVNNLFEESVKFIKLNNLDTKEKPSVFALEFIHVFKDTNKSKLVHLLQQNLELIQTSSIQSYKDGSSIGLSTLVYLLCYADIEEAKKDSYFGNLLSEYQR